MDVCVCVCESVVVMVAVCVCAWCLCLVVVGGWGGEDMGNVDVWRTTEPNRDWNEHHIRVQRALLYFDPITWATVSRSRTISG